MVDPVKALQAQWPSSDQARSALVPKFTTRGRNSTSCSSANLEILIRAFRHDVVLNRLLTLVGAGWGVLRHAGLGGRTLAIQVSPSAGSMMQKGPTRMSFRAYWRQANSNPSPRPFLALLRERYLDLSVDPGAG